MAGGALCFIDACPVIRGPGKIGNQNEKSHGDHRHQQRELCRFHNFVSSPSKLLLRDEEQRLFSVAAWLKSQPLEAQTQ
jgi:hypothetical protein